MADIFISYKREEADKARLLAKGLEHFGFTVWWDVALLSGDEFRDVIVEMIDKCKAVIVLWSPASIKSKFVIDEASYAQRQDKLLPAMLEETDLPFGFGSDHADSLVGWTGQVNHDGFKRLLAAVEHKTGKHASIGEMEAGSAREKAEITAFQAAAKLKSYGAWTKFLKDYPGTVFRNFIEAQMVELKAQAPSSSPPQKEAYAPPPAVEDEKGGKSGWIVSGVLAAVLLAGVGSLFVPGLPWSLDKGETPQPTPTPQATPTIVVETPTEPAVDTTRQLAEADEEAWRRAVSRGTVAAYKSYRDNDDHTLHQTEVETALIRYTQAVTRLQTALNAKGFSAGVADGVAGSGTRRAVEAFRAKVNFSAPSLDLTQIDPAPISSMAASVEAYEPPPVVVATRPTPTQRPTPTDPYPVGRSFTDCSGCPEMVVVPSGSFTMGSPSSEPDRDDDEGPQRTIQIGYKFAVGKFEVTWAQWEACVSAGGCDDSGQDDRGEDEGWGKGSRPVINVSWHDAKAYAAWLSRKTGHTYRLLSEAEWEYATRAGTKTSYSWGPNIGRNKANCDGCGSRWDNSKTAPVGSFPANAFGLHDMHGNVWEWVEDCYKSGYSHAPSDGSAFTNCSSDSYRVNRGGSWNFNPRILRSAVRSRLNPTYRYDNMGFRLARTLP